jgi:hypothetical protein
MRLRHFLPARRLDWAYLRKLHRGGGASTVGLDPYGFALLGGEETRKEQLRRTWQWQALSALSKLIRYREKGLRAAYYPLEGDPDVLEIERLFGRITALLQQRGAYAAMIRQVLKATWMRTPPPASHRVVMDREREVEPVATA